MAKEIEAKFLNVEHDLVRQKLRSAGARLEEPMRLMRRAMFDYPDGRLQKDNWGRLRVRDEGDKVTLAYKQGGEAEYSDEHETTVGSYDETIAILKAVGFKQYSFQESKRESWKYKDVEVVLDEWPFLKPYIEIEGPTEDDIKQCAKDLGFPWDDAAFGNVDTAYRLDYPGMRSNETVGAIAELSFSMAMPDWLVKRLQS